MKLNHINLTVTDVRAVAGFLETYFGMRQMDGNAGMAFLTHDGFVLTLMKAGKGVTVDYPGMFHIGFFSRAKRKSMPSTTGSEKMASTSPPGTTSRVRVLRRDPRRLYRRARRVR